MFGREKIVKTIEIEGMSCAHCAKKVETALKEIKQVKSVKVFLEEKKAEVILKENIEDKILIEKIEDIGFKAKI